MPAVFKKSVCLVSLCIIKSICFALLCIIASVFRTQVIYFNTLHSAHLPIFLAAPRKTASYPPAIREAREGCRRDRTAEVLLCVARLKIMLRWKRGSPALVAHNGQMFQKIFWSFWERICLKKLHIWSQLLFFCDWQMTQKPLGIKSLNLFFIYFDLRFLTVYINL